MQTKAYFASSIGAALEFARAELGENALLVSSKPAPPEARQFGRLEVTFAWDPREQPVHRLGPPMQTAVRKTLLERLVLAGFSQDLAADIDAGTAAHPGSEDVALVEELTRRIPIARFADIQPGESRVLAFIGPPGRGKTTSLAKIAVNKGISRRLPVRICSAGAQPGGSKERVARFAAILGTPFQSHETLAGMLDALDQEEWQGLTLIDTPGISPSDRNELGELKHLLSRQPGIETHLVLRSDMTCADMLHTISRFSLLTPSRLLFTGGDEVVRITPVIETLIQSRIPATFIGIGQRVPQDIEELNAERLARAVWVDARHTPGGFTKAATA